MECLPPVKNEILDEAKTLLKRILVTIEKRVQLSQNTMAQFFLLKTNTSYLILVGEFKTKNHLINFLLESKTSDISENEYSFNCALYRKKTINYEPKDLDSNFSSGTK